MIMRNKALTRRDLLLKCAALGGLRAAPQMCLESVTFAQESAGGPRKPTPWNELGPFYKRKAPKNAKLRVPGDPGTPLSVAGRIFDTRGNAVEGARIEVWQADHRGRYDLDGYRYRSALVSDAAGTYAFDSVIPGHYPARICQHIHYIVQAPDHKPLTTQLYFATDPVFDGDPARNYSRDPLILDPDLVRPVTLKGDPGDVVAAVNFEIVLERL
jgi:protocatechuate 3,4-dioxygenase beta subunit